MTARGHGVVFKDDSDCMILTTARGRHGPADTAGTAAPAAGRRRGAPIRVRRRARRGPTARDTGHCLAAKI